MQELLTTEFLSQLLISILVIVVIYIVSRMVFDADFPKVRRAVGVFAVASATLTTIWLRQNPDFTQESTAKIAGAAIALVVAFLVFLRRRIS